MNRIETKMVRYEIGDYIVDILPSNRQHDEEEWVDYYLSCKGYGHHMFMFGCKKEANVDEEERMLIGNLLHNKYVEAYWDEVDAMENYYEDLFAEKKAQCCDDDCCKHCESRSCLEN